MKNIITNINNYKNTKFGLDTIWLIISQGVLLIIGFLINIIISFKFNPETFGIYSQTIGFYLILSTLFSIGLNANITKKIASSNQEEFGKILSTNLIITLIISLTLSLISVVFCLFFPNLLSSDELAKNIIIIIISLPFFNLNKNFSAYLTGIRNQKLFSSIRTIRWVLTFLFILISCFVFKNKNLIYFSFLFSESIIFLYFCLVFSKLFFYQFNFQDIKSNFNFGINSMIAEVFAVLNENLDIIIIGYLLTKTEVGIYSFIIFFARTLNIFPGILQQNVNPLISKYYFENKISQLQEKLNEIIKINWKVLLLQSIFIIISFKSLTYFYKHEFNNSIYLLILVTLGSLPAALIGWSGGILVMTGKLKENNLRTIIILISSTTTTFLLSYFFGLIGTCVATMINSLIAFLLVFNFVKKTINIKII